MTQQLLVSREARADIEDAIGWLTGISARLPVRFGEELDRVYSLIASYPEMYPRVYKRFGARCCASSRTPSSTSSSRTSF